MNSASWGWSRCYRAKSSYDKYLLKTQVVKITETKAIITVIHIHKKKKKKKLELLYRHI